LFYFTRYITCKYIFFIFFYFFLIKIAWYNFILKKYIVFVKCYQQFLIKLLKCYNSIIIISDLGFIFRYSISLNYWFCFLSSAAVLLYSHFQLYRKLDCHVKKKNSFWILSVAQICKKINVSFSSNAFLFLARFLTKHFLISVKNV